MKRSSILIAFVGLVGVSMPALAVKFGDPEAGKAKSQACMACHGADVDNPQFPTIAGQHPGYLLHSLRAYKNGDRENAVMAGQVANLSDADLEDIAAYWSTLESELHAIDYDGE